MPEKTDKLPSYQWYPGDWRKDPGVKMLSLEEKGAWRELLDWMWEARDRGKMSTNGKPWSTKQISRLLEIDESKAKQVMEAIIEYGVASVEPETGVVFCRRMVRFRDLSEARAKAGRKGGVASGEVRRSKRPKHNASKATSSSSPSGEESASTLSEGAVAPPFSATPGAVLAPENQEPEQDLKPCPIKWPDPEHCEAQFWLKLLPGVEAENGHISGKVKPLLAEHGFVRESLLLPILARDLDTDAQLAGFLAKQFDEVRKSPAFAEATENEDPQT